jgi:tetratricopeptide (TPR) repeat protein
MDEISVRRRRLPQWRRRYEPSRATRAAIASYTEAIRLKPTAASYERRAALHGDISRMDYDNAIADYTEAIRLKPTAESYDRRARLQRDHERALADCSEAIRLKPTAERYINRADVYSKLGDTERAFADYDTAISPSPETVTRMRAEVALSNQGENKLPTTL